MSIPLSQNLISQLESLDDRELTVVLGGLLLGDAGTIGASPPTEDDKARAVETLVRQVAAKLPSQTLATTLRPLIQPGPIGVFIDLLGGSLVEGLDTRVKLVVFGALASRYGLTRLFDKFAVASEGAETCTESDTITEK